MDKSNYISKFLYISGHPGNSRIHGRDVAHSSRCSSEAPSSLHDSSATCAANTATPRISLSLMTPLYLYALLYSIRVPRGFPLHHFSGVVPARLPIARLGGPCASSTSYRRGSVPDSKSNSRPHSGTADRAPSPPTSRASGAPRAVTPVLLLFALRGAVFLGNAVWRESVIPLAIC